MTEILHVLTSWKTGPDGTIYPALEDGDYSARWLDVTEQPAQNVTPNPNQVIFCVECDAATADRIATDPLGFVLSRETI